MRIIRENPRFLWPIIKWRFPHADPERIIISFGDRIYAKGSLPPSKIEHERVHLAAQRHSRLWAGILMIPYLFSARFRLRQEIPAYQAEWRWIFLNVHDRELRARLKREMCIDLSSALYGNIITYDKANIIISQAWQA